MKVLKYEHSCQRVYKRKTDLGTDQLYGGFMEKEISALLIMLEDIAQNDKEKRRLLKDRLEKMQRKAFRQGYEYAIQLLQESLVSQTTFDNI